MIQSNSRCNAGKLVKLSLLIGFFIALVPQCIASDLYTIKLTAQKPTSPRSRLRRLQIPVPESNLSEPLDDFFMGTDLQWFGNLSFGTPPQPLTVVFDTGSFGVELTDSRCENCPNQKPFFSNESTTFVDLNKTSVVGFGTGVGVQPSDSENLTVFEGTDTVTILGLSAPNISLSLILNQTAGFDKDPFSGIVGMGLEPNQSIFKILNKNNVSSLFALFLTPESEGNAEITLGGIDPSKVNGNLTFVPVAFPPPPSGEVAPWILNTSSIAVNGNTTPILSQNAIMLFDSGTSNLVFEPNLTQEIYEQISPDIKPHGTLGAFGLPCSQIDSISANISFTFTDEDGQQFNLTVPREEFNVGPFDDDPETCQTVINALDFGEGINIVGGSLLKHYYSIWDVDHAKMGFVIPFNQSQSSTNESGSANLTRNSSSSVSLSEHICFTFSLIVVFLSTLVFI